MEKKQVTKNHVESILYFAKEPLTIEFMTKKLQELDEMVTESTVIRWVFELQNEFKDRGINIRQVAGGFEMATNPNCHDIIELLAPKEYETLSRSVLETVTIIAYNQPATRAVIARMRNVKNPDAGIESAMESGLIAHSENGYYTTEKFLKYFGINDLKELPEVISEERKSQNDKKEVEEELMEILEEKAEEAITDSSEENLA